MRKVIEASQAVGEAVRLCEPKVVPMFPITPQTHIVEYIAKLINNGGMKAEAIDVESEHSAISAALGAQATGVRTFTATSSQGLALMFEILHVVSGLRLPIVMAIANRSLSAPINIWNDHQDTMSCRDTGWIQIYVESAQEAHDSIIQAYKIGENKDVLLPVMVCLDGFTLSHVHEPVNTAGEKEVKRFLPGYLPAHTSLNPEKPISIGPIAYPNSFMEFKKAQQDAMEKSIEVIQEVNKEFETVFGRSYGDGLIETYKTDDADYALVCMGTACGTARVLVDALREKNKKIGLIKLRTFRPFPKKQIQDVCKKIKAIAVIDRSVSFGNRGAAFTEISEALESQKTKVCGFIAGLGGRDITLDHLEKAINQTINGQITEEWLM